MLVTINYMIKLDSKKKTQLGLNIFGIYDFFFVGIF